MTKLQEAHLRHAKHYLEVAQRNRGNLNPLDLPNIVVAVNYLAELGDWELLAAMVSAVSDYWLKVSQWNDYVKFNMLLLSADLEHVEERIKVVSKLAEIEEFRGNYEKASGLYKDLMHLYGQREANPPEDTLRVLSYLYKLARIKNDDAEAHLYLELGISTSREHNIQKDQVDFFLELALLHERAGDIRRAYETCEIALRMARVIGYYSKELDILILIASILLASNELMRARDLCGAALKQAERLGALGRAYEIRQELAKLDAVMNRNIFISYNHQDRDFAGRLACDLKTAGLSVWWDQWEIRVGDSIIQKVSDGMTGSAHLVVVLSPSSVKSDWVKREVGSALMRQLSAEKDIVPLPVLIADCEIPVLLREIKYADFRQDYKAGFDTLLEVLRDA